jgi:hypothetical protein
LWVYFDRLLVAGVRPSNLELDVKANDEPAAAAALVGGLTPTLTEPMCYLSLQQESMLRAHGLADLVPHLPGWVSQARISHALFGKKGERLVSTTAQHVGNFLWATEFANVHATFAFTETPIVVSVHTQAASACTF